MGLEGIRIVGICVGDGGIPLGLEARDHRVEQFGDLGFREAVDIFEKGAVGVKCVWVLYGAFRFRGQSRSVSLSR